MQTTIHIAKSPVRVRISKAVTTVQLVIVIAIVIVVIGGVFLFNPSRDSTPPVVVLKAISTEVEEDNPIQFSAGDSYDNVGIVSYRWDLGDGTTRVGENIVHAYSEAGDFTVTLTVADEAGNEEKDTIKISVLSGVPWPTNGWLTSTPEEQKMDSTKLEEMMEHIDEHDYAIDSILVVRNGYIVWEEYPSFYTMTTPHQIRSATKSFTSAVLGIAIQEGYIENVDQKVVDFFPEKNIQNLDSRKESITIEHLLTMSEGLDWFHSLGGTTGEMFASRDWVQFVLNRPMVREPGEEWYYHGGASHLLSAIITETTGRSAYEFAREFLFDPLNMTSVSWPPDPQGNSMGYSDLYISSRDMAKFGYLFLNNGSWEGEQIISEEWVAESIKSHFFPYEGQGYGYQWWTIPHTRIYQASGLYGQRILVIPELDMVIVFTADSIKGIETGIDPPEMGMLHYFIGAACDWELYPSGTYSKYGFSFDYPSGMTFEEYGIWWNGSASEASGIVQALDALLPYGFGVIWDSAESPQKPEAYLEEFYDVLESFGNDVENKGSLMSSSKDGHGMVYQFFHLIQRGTDYSGVIGSWSCDVSDRTYIFFHFDQESTTQHDLFTEFQRLLDSLACH